MGRRASTWWWGYDRGSNPSGGSSERARVNSSQRYLLKFSGDPALLT